MNNHKPSRKAYFSALVSWSLLVFARTDSSFFNIFYSTKEIRLIILRTCMRHLKEKLCVFIQEWEDKNQLIWIGTRDVSTTNVNSFKTIFSLFLSIFHFSVFIFSLFVQVKPIGEAIICINMFMQNHTKTRTGGIDHSWCSEIYIVYKNSSKLVPKFIYKQCSCSWSPT